MYEQLVQPVRAVATLPESKTEAHNKAEVLANQIKVFKPGVLRA